MTTKISFVTSLPDIHIQLLCLPGSSLTKYVYFCVMEQFIIYFMCVICVFVSICYCLYMAICACMLPCIQVDLTDNYETTVQANWTNGMFMIRLLPCF